jgi:imidazolonepropionase-like amidohydrolase
MFAAMRWPTFGSVAAITVLATSPPAQSPPDNGPRPSPPTWHALVHATAVTAPGKLLRDATIVVRDGAILAVAEGLAAPDGARVHDCTGLTVFAALIDPYVPIDAPEPPPGVGRHPNPQVRAEVRAVATAGVERKTRLELRRLGFAVAGITPRVGILRGIGAAQLLLDDDPRRGQPAPETMLAAHTYHSATLTPGGDGYPGSAMGAIALLRQTFADAQSRRRAIALGLSTAPADALDALLGGSTGAVVPVLFETQDELEVLRAAKLADEFGLRAGVLGSGTEFRRLDAVVATKLPLILPIEWPEPPDVDSLPDQDRVSLRELQTWEHAPANPARLAAAGATFALTTHRLRDRAQFAERVREAIAAGLPGEVALAALTTAPARLLGIDDRAGTIATGKLANLIVVRGADASQPFAKGNTIVATWVAGIEHRSEHDQPDSSGSFAWRAALGEPPLTGTLTIEAGSAKLKLGDTEIAARNFERQGNRIHFLLAGDSLGEKGTFLMTGEFDGDELRGQGLTVRGRSFGWRATRNGTGAPSKASGSDQPAAPPPPLPTGLPFGAYARSEPAGRGSVLIDNATLWTSGPRGIVRDGALLIIAGKVVFAGPRGELPQTEGVPRIDARGKHVTPGLIDCHSHTAISGGVNEGGQAVTAEVRIADVINPDDINVYRQLAGGLTAANLLHGSANPIGGQNAVVKLRWGCRHPDDMLLRGAPSGIKFALGENPKRARGRDENTRYPRTRQGVEVILRDRFTAAREYAAKHTAWSKLTEAERTLRLMPDRDLELEALAEVLAGTRLVHCHSYRQDEILMLCRVAQDFGFKIGTFQHVLEGYKVADAIRERAIGASSFSDWWAYKFEVYDAVPHNGELMHRAGVNVSFNSDSSELARRMNTEAAKAVKYGDLEPAVALQFVTLNPAIQLGVQDRVGSLEVGKDGDFAIWSGDPLRTTTRCEATYVDGVEMFSLAADRAMRGAVETERSRILQKLLEQPSRGSRRDSTERRGDGADGYDYGCGWCGCEELGR